MGATKLTVTEVNQNFSRARHALAEGPVIITERGEPAFVLMTYEAFRQRQEGRPTLLQRIDLPGTEDIDFEPPRLGPGFRPAELD
jgi:prevent-host-death family protein